MEEYVAKATGSLSNTIRARNNEYHGFYRGTVVNNEDPKERGRCKIFVRGVYNEDFKEDSGNLLPWAEPCQPLFCGGMGDDGANGTFQCPDMNSTVWCFFENSDILKPVFFGQTTDANGKFSTKHCKMKWEKMHIDLYRGTDKQYTSDVMDSLSASNQSTDTDDILHVMSLSANTDTISIARKSNAYRFAGKNIHDTAKTEDFTRYAYHDIVDTADTNDFYRSAGNDIIDTAGRDVYSTSTANTEISAGGSITSTSTTDTSIIAGGEINTLSVSSTTLSAVSGAISIFAPKSDIIIDAANSVIIKAGVSTTITAADIVLTGKVTINGDCDVNGATKITKTLNVTDEATLKGVAFSTHKHYVHSEYSYTDAPQS